MTEFKTIFVVVGSTKFDNLVKTVSSEEFIKVFNKQNYTIHVIQRRNVDGDIQGIQQDGDPNG